MRRDLIDKAVADGLPRPKATIKYVAEFPYVLLQSDGRIVGRPTTTKAELLQQWLFPKKRAPADDAGQHPPPYPGGRRPDHQGRPRRSSPPRALSPTLRRSARLSVVLPAAPLVFTELERRLAAMDTPKLIEVATTAEDPVVQAAAALLIPAGTLSPGRPKPCI